MTYARTSQPALQAGDSKLQRGEKGRERARLFLSIFYSLVVFCGLFTCSSSDSIRSLFRFRLSAADSRFLIIRCCFFQACLSAPGARSASAWSVARSGFTSTSSSACSYPKKKETREKNTRPSGRDLDGRGSGTSSTKVDCGGHDAKIKCGHAEVARVSGQTSSTPQSNGRQRPTRFEMPGVCFSSFKKHQ